MFGKPVTFFDRVSLFFVLLKLVTFVWTSAAIWYGSLVADWDAALGTAEPDGGIKACLGLPGPLQLFVPKNSTEYREEYATDDNDRTCAPFGPDVASPYFNAMHFESDRLDVQPTVEDFVRTRHTWFITTVAYALVALILDVLAIVYFTQPLNLGALGPLLYFVFVIFAGQSFMLFFGRSEMIVMATPTVFLLVLTLWLVLAFAVRVLIAHAVDSSGPDSQGRGMRGCCVRYEYVIRGVLLAVELYWFVFPLLGYLWNTLMFDLKIMLSHMHSGTARLVSAGFTSALLALIEVCFKTLAFVLAFCVSDPSADAVRLDDGIEGEPGAPEAAPAALLPSWTTRGFPVRTQGSVAKGTLH